MNNLESIVPPLELCKRIPAGKFADSALVYIGGKNTELIVRPRASLTIGDYELLRSGAWEMYPAPTLAEILEKLRRAEFTTALFTCGDTWMLKTLKHNTTVFERDDNPTAAALRLWLEVEGVEK